MSGTIAERDKGFATADVGRKEATGDRLDLKKLRLAVHGWWLGNPLVYKPGVADIWDVARELASAGAASGTVVLSDAQRRSDGVALSRDAIRHDRVEMVLMLRPPVPHAVLGMATGLAVTHVAQDALGSPCALLWPWDTIIRRGRSGSRLCRVAVEEQADVAFVHLYLALARLLSAVSDAEGMPSLFARHDWREVFLARILHALEVLLKTSMDQEYDNHRVAAPVVENTALHVEWERQLGLPRRAMVYCRDGSRIAGMAEATMRDGALLLRQSDGAQVCVRLDDGIASCGIG